MTISPDFVNAIKQSLLLHLEDEVRDYCVRNDMDVIDDIELMSEHYEYAKEQLFC